MKKLFFSLVAISTLASVSYAGGKYVEPPKSKPIVIDSWSGPYLGVQFGFISGKATIILPNLNKKVKPSGVTAGVFAGYNWRMSNDFLFGVEGDINYISADKTINWTSSITTALLVINNKYSYKLRQYWDASLRVRLGKVIDDKYLPYITAGAAWTKIGTSYPGSAAPLGTVKKKTLTGWTVGAGIEMKINKNVNARIQYRYSDYGSKDFMHGITKSSVKNFKTHSVRLGISYSFN